MFSFTKARQGAERWRTAEYRRRFGGGHPEQVYRNFYSWAREAEHGSPVLFTRPSATRGFAHLSGRAEDR